MLTPLQAPPPPGFCCAHCGSLTQVVEPRQGIPFLAREGRSVDRTQKRKEKIEERTTSLRNPTAVNPPLSLLSLASPSMPNRSPRRRQDHATPGGSRHGSHRSPAAPPPSRRRVAPAPIRRARDPGDKVLPRSSSAPALWSAQFVSHGADGSGGDALPRHYTCTDICTPGFVLSPSPPKPTGGSCSGGSGRSWEGKVVVSVTVEGSPGPVRAMVRLGASVEDTIGAVVDTYGREGRSPKLDPAAVASFQLHHNHFCLQSLDKADTLGQVGGRSFYLRRNCAAGGGGGGEAAARGQGVASDMSRPRPLVQLPAHPCFLCTIAGRLSKMGRRILRLWKALCCAAGV